MKARPATAARSLFHPAAITIALIVLTGQTSPAAAQTRGVYYRYCSDARRAGAAPIRRGEPGYSAHLDRDGDGIACEPYKGGSRSFVRNVRTKRRR